MHIERVFCPFSERDKVPRWNGLIYGDEDAEFGLEDSSTFIRPRRWDYFKNYRSIVVLGPPRHGKTQEFTFQASRVNHGFVLNVRELVRSVEPEEGFDRPTRVRWQQWLSGEAEGELFIDGTDEGKYNASGVIKAILRWLQRLPSAVTNRLRVHVSCRESEWLRIDAGAWNDFFPPVEESRAPAEAGSTPNTKATSTAGELSQRVGGSIVLCLLDLTDTAIRQYCRAHHVDSTILKTLSPKTLRLLQRPQTLLMLIDDFKRTGRIADSGRTLYERDIDNRLQEWNEFHQYMKTAPVPLQVMNDLADSYAAAVLLSGREVIAQYNISKEEHVPAGLMSAQSEVETALFNSGVFERFADHQYRFSEPGLTDYQAAKHLDGCLRAGSIKLNRVVDLFFSHLADNEVVPRLAGLAGWLCTLNTSFRGVIGRRAPVVLLNEHIEDLKDEDKIAIWDWLQQRYATREWFDDRPYERAAEQLATAALKDRFERVLEDPTSFSTNLRILALKVMCRGRAPILIKPLISIINDGGEINMTRRYAAQALAAMAPEQLTCLKAWLDLPSEEDPDKDLCGTALTLLWPEYIDVQALIEYLRMPSPDNHIGPYRMFVLELAASMNHGSRAELLASFDAQLDQALAAHSGAL
ncbi:MAG: hypothetical protein ACREVE_06620 [Gammaproteobacteria bacterium]